MGPNVKHLTLAVEPDVDKTIFAVMRPSNHKNTLRKLLLGEYLVDFYATQYAVPITSVNDVPVRTAMKFRLIQLMARAGLI
jgi:hypothetical protein